MKHRVGPKPINKNELTKHKMPTGPGDGGGGGGGGGKISMEQSQGRKNI